MANDWDNDSDEEGSPLQDLQTKEVYDIMIPRADIVSLDLNNGLDAVFEKMSQNPFNRYPVCKDSSDDILGYISVKTVFQHWVQKKKMPAFEALLESPLFTVRSRLVLDLLEEMRREKIYMALVVDEYGGVDGLVTQKDLMDAVLTCFQKETHNGDYTIKEHEDGRLSMDARLPIGQLEEHLGCNVVSEHDNRDDVDTVGGLVFLAIGRIPKRGEVIYYNEALEFSITDADARRIKRVTLQQL